MTAQDLILFILFRLFGLPANAKSADVILAAVGDENVVEVSQANWAVILVDISLLPVLVVVA